jgi:hypothetical protein
VSSAVFITCAVTFSLLALLSKASATADFGVEVDPKVAAFREGVVG